MSFLLLRVLTVSAVKHLMVLLIPGMQRWACGSYVLAYLVGETIVEISTL